MDVMGRMAMRQSAFRGSFSSIFFKKYPFSFYHFARFYRVAKCLIQMLCTCFFKISG